ncbi:hypothetical protein FDECE_9889 [Fusarium decemcellulare]|nr:hypothetical protein FDECE_9889 [Fusarium decemcellulare]
MIANPKTSHLPPAYEDVVDEKGLYKGDVKREGEDEIRKPSCKTRFQSLKSFLHRMVKSCLPVPKSAVRVSPDKPPTLVPAEKPFTHGLYDYTITPEYTAPESEDPVYHVRTLMSETSDWVVVLECSLEKPPDSDEIHPRSSAASNSQIIFHRGLWGRRFYLFKDGKNNTRHVAKGYIWSSLRRTAETMRLEMVLVRGDKSGHPRDVPLYGYRFSGVHPESGEPVGPLKTRPVPCLDTPGEKRSWDNIIDALDELKHDTTIQRFQATPWKTT